MFSRRIIAKISMLLILLPALIFSGCGQKGDLYLPDDEAGAADLHYVHGSFLV